ncbi:hypothetical protein BDP55DRAFT_683006 [Colletotrichum godetiae]|uniref:AAA+ ATPase domain-containing protein n=1 Tax=Colletotrichum godetiae TaxID=1209918 RepID=A0AAJ0A863_9PEZI|nr:uncharacterized protein BDP55DRAFT_683006 [Colletotrichum godetiae]KAK1658314.1 hypothetical protein BDP55DRAFT_683006 [Colletotrichum godetiae]
MSFPSDTSRFPTIGEPGQDRPASPSARGYSTSVGNHSHSGPGTDTREEKQEVSQDAARLFISSTISRDETLSQARQKQRILSNLKDQLTSGSLQLNSSRRLHSHSPLEQPERGRMPQNMVGIPPEFPPSRAPIIISPRSRSSSRSPRSRSPPSKASKDTKWRKMLRSEREMSSDELPKEENVGQVEQLSSNNRFRGDEKGNVFDQLAPEEERSPNQGVSLAETLASMTEKHLGIDVLDQSREISNFVSYLLDTIQILQSQADCRDADSSGSDSGSDLQDEELVISKPFGYQVVHRILCSAILHNHDGTLGENEPVNRKSRASRNMKWLHAEKEILNLHTWLIKRPSLCFIVIKEHRCAQDQRAEIQRFRDRNHVTPSGRQEKLRVVSPELLKALRQVAEFQIYRDSELGPVPEMEAPYLFLFHHRRKLEALAETGSFQEVILPLMGFLKQHYEAEYTEAEEMFLQGHVNDYHIHKLFKPSQMVLKRRKGEPQVAFVLEKYSLARQEDITLQGWNWHYNGHELHRAMQFEAIAFVPEERTKICDLDIHPVEYAREEDIKALTQRGNKFWSMRDQVYTCYTGWERGSKHQYVSARFMIDTATYQIMHGHSTNAASEPPSKTDPWPMRVNRREDLPHKAEMLLPATVYGFNLKEKKWANLYVKNIHEVDWNFKAFDRLVLDAKTKEMIRALVDVQTSAKKMDDIITGKGNGLIILLHGSPGTGKTLTAESVAEIAEKPLYRVTCGDIGTDARDVEKYLETVMYLGKTWDCVLLLDEADVFLEERTMADLQRNSLVSVFLRLLEYYEGILILTSNRVGTFDEAFKSRIQVAIHYDNLTKMSRKAIWQNFFDMIEESTEEDANMPELERRLDQLASEEMNGRQIRNALLTARQLAKHRKERLDWEHLSQVIKTSAAFNKYLKAVRGHTDEQWARGESLR